MIDTTSGPTEKATPFAGFMKRYQRVLLPGFIDLWIIKTVILPYTLTEDYWGCGISCWADFETAFISLKKRVIH